MKYYKIVYGYGLDEYLPITEQELHKAIVLFLEGNGRGVFESGAVRGQDIMRIVEDWHRVRGWNKGWKMTPDDYEDIQPLTDGYRNTYQDSMEVAKLILKENKRDLLSLPLSEAKVKLLK